MKTPKKIIFQTISGLICACLGGALFIFAFPPYGIWPFVLFGWVPVLIAQYWLLPVKISSLAPALGVYVWLQGYLGPVFSPIGTFMVWLPLVAALLSLLTDFGLRAFHEKTSYRYFVVSGVVSWAAIEMIRLFLPIAGTWAFIAYPFYKQPWAIQPVSIFGIIGMGMLIMMINYTVALSILLYVKKKSFCRATAIISLCVTLSWVVISLAIYYTPLHTPTITVAAVQPKVSTLVSANAQDQKHVEGLHRQMIGQTREAASQGAQFVVWPEGALLWDPQMEDPLKLRELAIEEQIYLVIGYLVIEDETVGFRNEATVIDPQGEFLGVFGKDHPVVFGGETSLSRGTYPVYTTSIGTIGTIICYDLDYTDTTRKLARQGVQLVGVPSNDWAAIAEKHYAHVVFRAVEQQVAMVKADGGFDSAIISPKGDIIALAVFPEGGEATLVAQVPLGSGKGTIDTHLGDWMGYIALIGMIFFTFFSGFLIKREKKLRSIVQKSE